MKKKILLFGWALGFVLAGCAAQNVALEKAVTDYQAAVHNESIVKNAPVALEDARHALEEAKSAKEETDINSLAYVAQKKVEIARLSADTRVIEQKQAALRENAKGQIIGDLQAKETATLEAEKQKLEKQLADEKAKATARGTEMTFPDGALFEAGKAQLKPGAALHLDRIARALKTQPERAVLVEGHTDNTGTDALNLKLSEERSKAVASYLTAKGVESSRIATKGYGKDYPIASNSTVSGREKNRRVDIVILEQGQTPESATLKK